MTDNQELLAAGILRDAVEDTEGMLEEIENCFGKGDVIVCLRHIPADYD